MTAQKPDPEKPTPKPGPKPDAELVLPPQDLDAGGKPFRFELRAAWLRALLEDHEATARGDAPGLLELRASKSGADITVHGTLTAPLVTSCARCLEPVDLDLTTDISALYVPTAKVKAPETGDYEFSAEEADTMPYDGEKVVLDDLVRDEIVLAIPMIPLCSESCTGMTRAPTPDEAKAASPTGGIDPRLAPLLQLRGVAKGTKNEGLERFPKETRRGSPETSHEPLEAQHEARQPRPRDAGPAHRVHQLRRAGHPAPRLRRLRPLQGPRGQEGRQGLSLRGGIRPPRRRTGCSRSTPPGVGRAAARGRFVTIGSRGARRRVRTATGA